MTQYSHPPKPPTSSDNRKKKRKKNSTIQIELDDAHTGLDKCEQQIKHHMAGETQLTICIKKSKNLDI